MVAGEGLKDERRDWSGWGKALGLRKASPEVRPAQGRRAAAAR